MLPGGALVGALVLNYRQHKRGRPTICSTARRHVPAPVLIGGWLVFTVWMVQHLIDGYSVEIDLSDLTD